MDKWLDSYTEVLNTQLFEFSKQMGVLVGFNVNIDKLIKINPKVISDVLTPEITNQLELDKSPLNSIVRSKIDFLSYLLNSIKLEKAEEVLTDSEELCAWIEKTFQIEDSKIGGQAGIIANLYLELGMEKVLLSLPELNNEIYNLLNPNILMISKKAAGYSINKISPPNSDKKLPFDHYVFEFKPGDYIVGNCRIENRRANRFILSHDLINTKLRFSKGLVEYCANFINEYSLAVISGFHLANLRMNPSMTLPDITHPIESMLLKWKEINPHLFIHLEIASTKGLKLRKTIMNKIFPIVDSIGLNEQELISFAEVINPDHAIKMMNSLNPLLIFEALKLIFDKYPNLRIHFHYLGYFMILSKQISNEEIVKRKEGLILSSLLAAIKVKGNEIISIDEIGSIPLELSTRGILHLKQVYKYLEKTCPEGFFTDEAGVFHSPSFSFVGVPTIVVEKPKKTVGLGDLISSVSILHELQ